MRYIPVNLLCEVIRNNTKIFIAVIKVATTQLWVLHIDLITPITYIIRREPS